MKDSENIFAQFNKKSQSESTSNSSEKAPEQFDNQLSGNLKTSSENPTISINENSWNDKIPSDNDFDDSRSRNNLQPLPFNQTLNKDSTKIPSEFQTAASLLLERQNAPRIPTGSKAMNRLLGGGVESKSITEFYGAYTTGKTQTSIQLAFNVALDVEHGGLNAHAVYIDTEGSFRPERIIQMANEIGVNPKTILNRIFVGRAHNSDIQIQLTENVYSLAETNNVKLLIIDSLTSTFRAEYVGKGALMDRQQKLNQHIRQISKLADQLGIAVVVTNQVSAVIDGYEQTIIPVGGNILAHGTTHRIQFTKSHKYPTIRFAKLIASPSLPETTISFEITQGGITDVSITSFNPEEEI